MSDENKAIILETADPVQPIEADLEKAKKDKEEADKADKKDQDDSEKEDEKDPKKAKKAKKDKDDEEDESDKMKKAEKDEEEDEEEDEKEPKKGKKAKKDKKDEDEEEDEEKSDKMKKADPDFLDDAAVDKLVDEIIASLNITPEVQATDQVVIPSEEIAKSSEKPTVTEQLNEDLLSKLNKLSDSVNSLQSMVEKLQKPAEVQTMEKAEKPSDIEELKKAFDDRFQKATDAIDSMRKENEMLKLSNEEIKKELSKPARPRASISNLQVIEKSMPQSMPTSKRDILSKLEYLRKSGKVTDDEVITFNVVGKLSDNCQNLLKGE